MDEAKIDRTTSGCQSAERLWPELPLNSRDDESVSRRGFLTLLMGSSAAFFLATLPFARRFLKRDVITHPKLAVARVADVAKGQASTFAYPDNDTPALLVHLNSGEWRAYAGTCTHLGCLVHWDTTTCRLVCPCHSGMFDALTGKPLAGPPPRALPQIGLRIENGIIYAVGVTA